MPYRGSFAQVCVVCKDKARKICAFPFGEGVCGFCYGWIMEIQMRRKF